MFEELKIYFGPKLKWEKIKEVSGLPVYLAYRDAYRFSWERQEFVLVCIPSHEKFGVTAFVKQQKVYQEAFQCNVGFSFENVSRAQRESLINHRIPFVSLPNQVYLPFMGMVLRDEFHKNNMVSSEQMMPTTQAVFLYLLYHDENEIALKSQIAEELGVTRTTLTRATKQLLAMGLITEEKRGKEIRVKRAYSGREFFEKARPFLINPVQRKMMIRNENAGIEQLKAGETALGEMSLLSPPAIMELAIYKGDDQVSHFKEADDRWEEGEFVQMELWKYDPSLFAKDGRVDVVSLALSLEDSGDERVENAIEEMMEEYVW